MQKKSFIQIVNKRHKALNTVNQIRVSFPRILINKIKTQVINIYIGSNIVKEVNLRDGDYVSFFSHGSNYREWKVKKSDHGYKVVDYVKAQGRRTEHVEYPSLKIQFKWTLFVPRYNEILIHPVKYKIEEDESLHIWL